MKAQKS